MHQDDSDTIEALTLSGEIYKAAAISRTRTIQRATDGACGAYSDLVDLLKQDRLFRGATVRNPQFEDYQRTIEEQVRSSKPKIDRHLDVGDDTSSSLACLSRNKQTPHLFMALFSYQGCYTTLHPFVTYSLPSFWFPVESESREIVIAVCRESYRLHIQRLLKYLLQQEENETFMTVDGEGECMEFLDSLFDSRIVIHSKTRNALSSAFGAFGAMKKPSLGFIRSPMLQELYAFVKKQRLEYGITGFPVGHAPPSMEFFTKFHQLPPVMDGEDEDDDAERNQPVQISDYVGPLEALDGKYQRTYVPLSLSAEVMSCMAFGGFFKGSLYAMLVEDLKLDGKAFHAWHEKKTLCHIGPMWKPTPRIPVRPWIREVSYYFHLSPAIFVAGWPHRISNKEKQKTDTASLTHWQTQMDELQKVFVQRCESTKQDPEECETLDKEMATKIAERFTTG